MVSSHEVLRTLASPQLLIIFHVLNLCLAPHEGVCNVNPTHLYQLKLLDEVKIEHIKFYLIWGIMSVLVSLKVFTMIKLVYKHLYSRNFKNFKMYRGLNLGQKEYYYGLIMKIGVKAYTYLLRIYLGLTFWYSICEHFNLFSLSL